MESSTQFDLQVAIRNHLSEIDRNRLLMRDEWEELFDHFLEETEALSEKGLTEKEAFAVSKLRFGETALIHREYEKVKPFAKVRKTLITTLMLIFYGFFVITSVNLLSLISLYCAQYFDLSSTIVKYGDFAMKMLFVGGIAAYFVQRLKLQRSFTKLEFLVVPFLGLTMPFIMDFVLMHISKMFMPFSEHFLLVNDVLSNIRWIALLSMMLMLIATYVMIFQERKHTKA